MSKPLSEMTLEELWQLFPIFLTEHNAEWTSWYEDEKSFLLSFLPDNLIVNHIGSTAVNGIWAKPIIDILLEVEITDFQIIKALLINNGYLCMAEDKYRIDFNKGYTETGFTERVFHLHLRQFGDNDEIFFRDYLISNQDVAKEYERLKLSLWKKFEHNRDAYTEAKTDFIKKYTDIAKSKPIIETNNLYLRELTLNDTPNLALVLSNPDSMRHYPHPFSAEEVKEWITNNIKRYNKDGFGLWAVIRKSDNQFLGDCGITLQNIDGDILPEIGFHIIKEYCNNGYATEAAEACKNYAIDVLGYKSIFSYSEIGNKASQRVVAKIGMKKVKTFFRDGIEEVVFEYCVK